MKIDREGMARPTPAELRQAHAELELARRRRELLFWTIAMTLAMTVLVAMTVAFVASLTVGSALDPAQIAVGTAIAGAGAGARLLGVVQRSAARQDEC